MPRYVILEHDYPELHWDFMLEMGNVLKTWKLKSLPTPGQTITAELSFDHRLKYLDYEGPISGERGFVVCCDKGHFSWQSDQDTCLVVVLQGKRFSGPVELNEQFPGQWQLTLKIS